MRLQSVLGWVATAVVVVVPSAYFLYTQFDDLTHQVKGYSFSETLPETIDAEGGDARVVSVLDRDRNVFFAVLKGDDVREHFYGEVCTGSARGSNCAYREKDDERDASPRDRKLARVTLDDLDADVVKRIRGEAGVGKEVPVGLRGRVWIVGSFEKGVAAVANLDGSRVHRAKSAREFALAREVASDPGR